MNAFDVFLEQYELVKRTISDISSMLCNADDISKLDVTDAITAVVDIFKGMLSIERYGLVEEQIKDINEKNNEIKEALVKLKNEQIYTYNLKVWEINDKIDTIKKTSLDLGIEDKTEGLSVLKWSNVYLYRDWKRNSYKKTLDYVTLKDVYNKVSEIENGLNIQNTEPIDLRIRLNFCEQILNNIKKEVKGDVSLDNVDELLDRCVSLFGNIVQVDMLVRQYVSDGIIKKQAEKNYKIITLYSELTKLKNKLFKVKSKGNLVDYNLLKDKLKVLNDEGKLLQNVIERYYGKCNVSIIKRFDARLNALKDNLGEIEKIKDNTKLDTNQLKQIDLQVKIIRGLFKNIGLKLKDPNMLKSNFNLTLDNMFLKLEFELEKLKEHVHLLEVPIKENDDTKKEIADRKNDIEKIEKILLKNSLNVDLRNILSNIKDNFNNICKVYNSKCPLLVKKVKSADNLYKKYKKECLLIGGLSSVSLLERLPLIPAIMHGNMVLGSKVPTLENFVNSVNTILGGMIKARRDENGNWYLSNGFKIDSSVAGTSLLQNLSISNIKNISLVKKIRNLMKKMSLKIDSVKKKSNERLGIVKDRIIEFNDNSIDIFKTSKLVR